MDWWLWCVLGLVLAAIELLTPGGFYVIFFGAGALVTGVVARVAGISPPVQWVTFSVLSVVALLLFRKPLLARLRTSSRDPLQVDNVQNETAIGVEEIAPGAVGKIELRGAPWSARNIGTRPIKKGERCRVTQVDGITLSVRAEGDEA